MKQEFQMGRWTQLLIQGLGVLFAVAGVCLLIFATKETSTAGQIGMYIVLCLVMMAVGVFCFAGASEKVTIDDYGITRETMFGKEELARRDIQYYHNGEKSLIIEPLPGTGKRINITKNIKNVDDIVAWVAGSAESFEEQERKRVLADTSLGENEEVIAARLSVAKKHAQIATGVIAAVAAATYFFTGRVPYLYLILFGCVVAAIGLLWYHRGFLDVFAAVKGPRGDIGFAFVIPAIALMLLGNEINLVTWAPIWPKTAAIAAVLTLATFPAMGHQFKKKAGWLMGIIVIGLFTAIACKTLFIANIHLDKSTPKILATTVVSKRVSGTKSRSYYLKVQPVPGGYADEELTISRSLWNNLNTGDLVEVIVSKGGLNMPWIIVR